MVTALPLTQVSKSYHNFEFTYEVKIWWNLHIVKNQQGWLKTHIYKYLFYRYSDDLVAGRPGFDFQEG
jgi:hypothetical protein